VSRLFNVVGVLVVCAGIDLLWQSRIELRILLDEWRPFAREVMRQGNRLNPLLLDVAVRRRRTSISVQLGLVLALLLGPTLVLIGIAMMGTNH
jgi:hypothetical protein